MLGLRIPLIIAPMAGGPSSVELVVATSNAGALGSIGGAYSSASTITEIVSNVRTQTKKPFAINLFIPAQEPQVAEPQIAKAIEAAEQFRNKLGLPKPTLMPPYEENFDEQFEAVLRSKPEVFSFVFGLLKTEYVKAAQKENIFLIGTATDVEEALALQESGVDAITLQGIEAGGHRGMFTAGEQDPEIPVLKLTDECSKKIKVPLIAAGGIMTAGDIQKVRSAGASAVQIGTAFLVCKEAGTSLLYRDALLANKERRTKTTRAFSGRLARGIENEFMTVLDKNPERILPFPAQNKFTRDIRAAAVKQGHSDCLSLWAGTGKGALWTGPAAELINQLFPNSVEPS